MQGALRGARPRYRAFSGSIVLETVPNNERATGAVALSPYTRTHLKNPISAAMTRFPAASCSSLLEIAVAIPRRASRLSLENPAFRYESDF